MSVFTRRFTEFPSLETLNEIEAVNVIDLAPQDPATGTGSGAVLCVGEFEDGPFAAGGDADTYDPTRRGVLEAFTSADLIDKYGGFGFQRTGNPYSDPCARFSGGELWNGSGFLKLKFLRANRLMVARVDTSVGEVAFTALACLTGTVRQNFNMSAGAWLSIDPAGGGATAADAIAATAATSTAGTTIAVSGGPVAGDAVDVIVDGNAPVRVTFPAALTTIGAVVARINAVLGATIASDSAGALAMTGLQLGTGGRIAITEVTAGTLTNLGFAAAVDVNGTGNVANLAAVTAAELATIINGTAALSGAGVIARAVDGYLRVCAPTSILASGAQVATIGLSTTIVNATDHPGFTIPAGTRVTDSTTEYLTMQTLTVTAGDVNPKSVKVRHSTDDGTGIGATASTVTTVTDQPSANDVSVTNDLAIGQALSDAAKDAAYTAALEATLAIDDNPSKQANFLLCARRTATLDTDCTDNAVRASNSGLFGRKYLGRAPLGYTTDQAIADVANNRSDRRTYCFPGLQVVIPEIATVGASTGGQGFTDDGVITVGADGPLATVSALLNPEENSGQETRLIDRFYALEAQATPFTIDTYKAFKAAGIIAPRIDEDSGTVFQSDVTSSLTSGRTTFKRRKFADFIQDSVATLAKPFGKKLQKQIRIDALTSRFESFLAGLLSETNPEAQRIEAYGVDATSGNTPELTAQGIRVWKITVRQLASLDAIVLQTEVGENAVIVTEVAA